MEAFITDGVYSTKTWRLLAAAVDTKLVLWDNTTPTSNLTVKDFGFSTTDVTSPALVETASAVDVGSGTGNFVSFEVANCTLDSISMNCINWVVTTTAENKAAFTAEGGYKKWSEGDNVRFWWWDGRDLD